ncbi:MAG: hypothetical protein HKN16_11905 [Saprospiraceae bacterium]|nr:hypothetical protein [Saprospiraceae bacterium]
MKFLKILFPALLFFVIGCSNDSANVDGTTPTTSTTTTTTPATNNTTTTPPATAEPAQNAAGVWHYTCPAGCAGGGGSATACPSCGATLAHNTAYHSSGTATQNSGSPFANQPNANSGSGSPFANQPGVPPVTTAEPAQNAAGVWHYTCPSGCAGGGGSATACSGCGATLAHNTAYHN